MRCAPLLYLLFASSISYAQNGTKDREPSNKQRVIPLADSVWNKLTDREKVKYCLKTGERDIQLCGRWGGGYTQNTRNYIFENTGQYYFLGEYTYSKRQLDVFRKYPDTIAWMLREDLFEKKDDLFYWHNIISRMPASKMVADALMDYYKQTNELESAPLTLLMGWMDRDSFPAYLQSDIYKKLEDWSVIKVPHSEKNKEILRALIKKYIYRLPFENDPYTTTTNLLYDSLKRAHNQLRTTSRLSDSVFNRLNARELLAYCETASEKATQICSYSQDLIHNIFLLPDKFFVGQPGNFSERQILALKAKRDSVAWYLLNGYRDKMIYGRNPAYSLVLLLHTWQIVPDILKADSLKLFNRYFYMSVLCQFMLINSYPPFLTFWQKNAVENRYVIRTRKNEEMILQLAADYYQWKMEGKYE